MKEGFEISRVENKYFPYLYVFFDVDGVEYDAQVYDGEVVGWHIINSNTDEVEVCDKPECIDETDIIDYLYDNRYIVDEEFHQYRGYVIKKSHRGFYECDNKQFRTQSQVKHYINEALSSTLKESLDKDYYIIVGIEHNGNKMYFSSEDSDWHKDENRATKYEDHDDALEVWMDVTRNGNAKYVNKVLGFRRVFVPTV